jgi:radical SAM protein with 4Fe4S-binding SPASM domain
MSVKPKKMSLKKFVFDKAYPKEFSVAGSPTYLTFCVTRRCNQACIHCNISATSLKRDEVKDVEFWLKLIEECEKFGLLRLTVTGGEPFFRKGWDLILERLCRARFGTIILTNATSISEAQIKMMSEAPVTLGVSLDGFDAASHDNFRKDQGGFDQTIKNLKKLRDAGIRFTINSVLHRDTVDHYEKIVDLSVDVGASRLVLAPIGRQGRGKLPVARKQYPEVEKLIQIQKNMRVFDEDKLDIRFGVYDENEANEDGTYNGLPPAARQAPGLCIAGRNHLAIDQDGQVYSCLRGLQERIAPIGDVSQASIMDVWDSSNWDIFRDTTKKCVSCRIEHIAMHPDRYDGTTPI